jgi:hypothetical protein
LQDTGELVVIEMRFFPLVVALVAAALVAPSAIAQNRANDIARFDVTTRVVNPDLQAFSATTFTIGNGDRWSGGGGFEPVKFRNMFLATGGDRRRIDANLQTLSQYNSWKSGAFDGAKVDVLRIETARFAWCGADELRQAATTQATGIRGIQSG